MLASIFLHYVSLQQEPSNPYDCNAVVVHAISSEGRQLTLGHVEKLPTELWCSTELLNRHIFFVDFSPSCSSMAIFSRFSICILALLARAEQPQP